VTEKTHKTTGGKLPVRIPMVLNEITLGQMIAMEKKYLDDLDIVSILSGLPKDELSTINDFKDFIGYGDYIRSLSRQISYLYNSDIIPRRVTFIHDKRKVVVDVLRNLSVEPAEAALAARDVIADEINEHIVLYEEDDWKRNFQPSLKSCCLVLAHYFFCRVSGEIYDEQEALKFCDEIKKMRVTEALPIARYFFECYPDLMKQKIGFAQQLRHYWRRKKVHRHLENSSL